MSKLVRLFCYLKDSKKEPFDLDIPRCLQPNVTKLLEKHGWTVEEHVIP